MPEKLEVTQEVFDKVLNITIELQPLSQGAFGFFTTKTRHAVTYSDPETRKKVQAELDHAVALLAIAHVMTIIEDGFPIQYWEEIVDDVENYSMLKAYKHIRNSTINGLTGNRCDDDEFDHFDKVMSSTNPIRGVASYDNKNILLAESAGNYAHSLLTIIMNKVIVEMHKRII